MFSIQRGELPSSLRHKIHLRTAALREWPNLTTSDLKRVNTERDLGMLVVERTGRTADEAAVEVRRWMQVQKMRPDVGVGILAHRPLS